MLPNAGLHAAGAMTCTVAVAKGQECQFARDPAVTKLEVTRKSNVDQISAFAAHMKPKRAL